MITIFLLLMVIMFLAIFLTTRKCPHCKSRNTIKVKTGFVSIQDNLCLNCGKVFDSLPLK